ncbi:MAG: alcohol dehydrogenase catalytic domain-containing protein [Bryobacterales bacterium]|nr:alcohol dehydrogenase catalytic domain-containing protein [Bryobacterales bacterium]
MRIAQLISQHRFQLTEAPPAAPAAGEIQVRVHYCGICGSDLHNFSEGSVGDTPSVFPMVLGHEPTGTVIQTGAGVTGWQPGDRAFLEPAIYCYHCPMCRTGRHNLCDNIRFLSAAPEPGYFRDIVSIPEHCLIPIPPGVGLAEGTLFEPLAVALHSLKFVDLTPGASAAVFGCGPIGSLTVAALKMHGIRRVFAVDPVPHRRDLARAMGADVLIDPAQVSPSKEILAATGKRGVETVLDCVTRDGSLDHACIAVAKGGRVVATGIPSEARPVIHFHELRRKEAPLFNVRRSNHETALAIDLLVERPAFLGPMVTHRHPLEDIERAFADLEAYRDGVAKSVVQLTA